MADDNKGLLTTTKSADTPNGAKLGLMALIAIVVSSMLEGTIFSLPQNTATASAVGPIIVAWIIAGTGIYFIANTFRFLADMRPDLQAGVYMYAQEGFGAFVGFNVAWGYWLMSCFGNVAFAVILMEAFDQFFPGVFTGGNNFISILCGSILIWGYNFLVLAGIRVAGKVNTFGTFAKLVPLVLFVVILGLCINYNQLLSNFWGTDPAIVTQNNGHPQTVSVLQQILAPMTVTLWAFIGVEGAVVLSGRAKKKSDVGKATLIGFVVALIMYILISVLPFGAMSQAQLAQLPNPSTAGVLSSIVGTWGSWLMSIGLIIAILVGWLTWTLLCAEIPMVAGQNGAFPKSFAKKNNHNTASVSLWVSSAVMQLAMLLVYFSNNAWVTMYNISALMVIPAYLMTTLYMVKICLNHQYDNYARTGKTMALCSGILGSIFCIFILYASDFKYVALIPVFLSCGLPVYIWSRKEKNDQQPLFSNIEKLYVAILVILDIVVISIFLCTDWMQI